MLRLEPDIGTTNIRNLASAHWRPWQGVESRCVVPATSFSEYGQMRGADIKLPLHWFASAPDAPLFAFAGIWTTWTSVRKAREGEVTIDIFAFPTVEPKCCRCADQPQGDAGDPHQSGRDRGVAERAVG